MVTVVTTRALYDPYEVHGSPQESDAARVVWTLEDGTQVILRPVAEDTQAVELIGERQVVSDLLQVQLLQHTARLPRTMEQARQTGQALALLGYDLDMISANMYLAGLTAAHEYEPCEAMLETYTEVQSHFCADLEALGSVPNLNIMVEDIIDD
jgi:hypothetical protein